jgi:sigma-54 dependent transcriptional regulator, acetoin dehydrogenase operon transcriptional activator AcoR
MQAERTRNPYLAQAKDRAKTDELWERFNVSGSAGGLERANGYEQMLLADWERCRTAGVSATMQHAPVLGPEEFQRVLKARGTLLERARPVLDKVNELIVGVPGILILGDEEGTILYITGDPRVRVRAASKSNLIEGGRWAERICGTNGIGTAIARKMPVHVYSSEHFCEGWHLWTCAGAPILDPITQDPLGVIDFTTYERDFRENAVALAYSLAANVSSELRLQRELEQVQLVHQHALYAARFPSDEVVVLDRAGRVVRSSAALPSGEEGRSWPHSAEESERVRETYDVSLPGSDAPIGSVIVATPVRRAHFHIPAAEFHRRSTFGEFVTADVPTQHLMERLRKVAQSELSVLLIGETGTGKEMIARYVHEESKRRGGPYIAVNCGAVNRELFESTFFGYERGAFTGADPKGRKGLFEAANGGTLFLDEIGEMPLDVQAGLLRVLETRTFRRVGSDRELATDARIVAATNRPLGEFVAQGSFRSDLFYRLSVVKFEISPLKDRPDDVALLVDDLLRATCRKYELPLKSITQEAWRALLGYPWPGNVRELRNVIESACVSSDEVIDLEDLTAEIAEGHGDSVQPWEGPREGDADGEDLSLRRNEARLILDALRKYKKVSLVAEALGLSRATLYRRFEALGIDHRETARSARVRRPS